jgi:hypothetical protein
VASTWYFRNSVQSFNGGGLARGGRGGGGRGAARAPAPPSASVLNSFRFEQAGNETRIVDEDGSIYLGQIQSSGDDLVKLEEASRPQSQLEARNRAAQETKLEPAMPQKIPVYFSVTGLNRTLSQQIVFTGQLQQAVSFPVNNGQTNATRAAAGQLLQAEAARSISTQNQVGSVSNVLLQQRIVGRARLSDSRELPVDAFQIQR